MILRKTNPVTRGAFTLMEMLVVVAIIVMLAGLSTWGYMRYLETAKSSKAKMDCSHISSAVEAYNIETGNYPGSLQELLQPVGSKPAYLSDKDLLDPWNRPYSYDPNSRNSLGKPKIFTRDSSGTEINNW